MTWTKTKPNRPGWWWLRYRCHDKWLSKRPVWVHKAYDGSLCFWHSETGLEPEHSVNESDGIQWSSGPIPEPKEKEET